MGRNDQPDATVAIAAILGRYHNIVTGTAAHGAEVRIVTPEIERPDLIFKGDGNGRAMLAIATKDGIRHVVFTRWSDGDSLHPENWPETIAIPS